MKSGKFASKIFEVTQFPSPDSSENPFLRSLPKKRLQQIAGKSS